MGLGTSRVAVGDRVMSITGGGAQAELAVIPESHGHARPRRIPWDQAGGFPEVFCTAYDALFTQAGSAAGERVLISGAAGGVGIAAVQLAHAAGAHVVASVRSPERQDGGRGPRRRRGHRARPGGRSRPLRRLAGAGGGGPGVAAVLPVLAMGGRVVVIGVGAGAKVDVNLLVVMGRRATIGGSTLRSRTVAEKAAGARGRPRARVAPAGAGDGHGAGGRDLPDEPGG